VPGISKRQCLSLLRQTFDDDWAQTREFYGLEMADLFPNTAGQDPEDEEAVEDDADESFRRPFRRPAIATSRLASLLRRRRRRAEVRGLKHHEQLCRFRDIWHTLSAFSDQAEGSGEEAWGTEEGKAVMPGRNADDDA
jgi:hypothetical protein